MCKVFFFLLRSVGRRDLSAGPEQKKKHHPGCFFFAPAPGKGRGRRSPVPARGQSKKKTPPRVFFFFCCGPGERQEKEKPRWAPARGQRRQGKEKPRWAPARGQSKKKNTINTLGGVFFFALAPCRRPTGLLLALPFPRAGAKKKNTWVVFFLLWPRAGAQRGFSFSCLSRGPQPKKKHSGWCSFFCSGPVPARGFSFPCLSPGPEQKKNTLGGVFFFAAAPRGRSLTHCGPGWRCLSLAGVVILFLLRPRPDRGGVFFCCGPARTLTHSLWAGAISARPGWCFFFCCGPAGSF